MYLPERLPGFAQYGVNTGILLLPSGPSHRMYWRAKGFSAVTSPVTRPNNRMKSVFNPGYWAFKSSTHWYRLYSMGTDTVVP